ncbi:hypothetical protein SAMN05421824_0011 [Hyunsoonleella jejuensis]|uniref:Uncharacterized protein n=1 Tax=Hyunsoonleella jejuensis TaxID=419940 RepID=A0A1H8ZRL3_9FLAO|nr:hypothetical protein [Hyunsoonleella jejuensis]SEP66901.1 hypothetical protein SAMN05421824_0011 [Hyunsoonleella jejuensis]
MLIVILTSITGFWNIYFRPDSDPTFYQNLHVLTTFIWLGLLLTQLVFIDSKHYSAHKSLGKSIFVVGPILIATLLLLSVHSASKSAARGEADMLVIQNIFPAIEVALLILLGFLFRNNRLLHGHFLMSTSLLFFGIALFFTLISFIPGYIIEGPETFYRFERAGITATYISVALGLILFLIQWRSGWPWLLVCILFFINGFIGRLIEEANQMVYLTQFIGSINELATFLITLVMMLVVLIFSLWKRKV